jgi:dynein heavy chain
VSNIDAALAAVYTCLQNGTERGWVLKGVDEINLLLEDMGLNLQSMMASPHVRPFAEDVRNWEQRLSLIGEAIEVGSCS